MKNYKFFSAMLLFVALAFGQNAMAQWTGAGTQESPYQIKSKEDLYTLATNVNSGTNYSGKYFLLTTDLAYTYTYAWNSTDYYASENNFTAIGAYGNSFKGHFDGGGHTISGVRIYKNGTTNADQLQGVFGNLSGGSVRNLTVADASITGYQQVGAIAGCNNGTIEDCVVASNVGIYRVADNASKHGGVVGANSNGNVRRCTSSATVKSHPKFANTISAICGGIIGYQSQQYDVNHYVEDNVALNVVVISGQSVGGAIIGYRTSGDNLNRLHLSRNYYRNCTINGSVNATNVGVGNPAGDMDGARSVHTLTLGANITATGESVVIGNTTCYASNTTVTLGHNNSTGYLVTYRLNGNALGGNTFTMPNNDNGIVSATLTPITYYVHFDKNNDGASGTMSDQQFTYGQAQNLTANAFTLTGYDFIGWSTTFDGEAEYTDGQSVSNLTAVDGETVTLYAKWNISNYNITYNLDGGTVATENPTTYNIETPTFSLNNPTQAGCTFDGWTGTGLTEATQTVTIAQGSTGDRSYTANWTHFAYALVLDKDITATPAPAATYNNTSYYTPGTEITLSYNVTPSAGYEFQGFLVNGSPIEGNTFVMPASDVTVSANLAAIPWGGAGTSDSPYIIIYAAQLDMLATRLNTGTGDDYASSGYNGIYFKLGADINYNPNELTNGENYTAIGSNYGNEDYLFNGTFDGDNHIISGIRINKPNYDLQGLFGAVGSTGTVKNVILDDAVVIGRNCVGGIAGNKLGTIENCRVINTNITGNGLVGGIAGHSANQTIENNMVLNTAITYDNTDIYNGGAIIGSQQSGSIGYNYYHNCTLNGVASNIGCGVASIGNIIFGDITENNAAVQAYTLTLSPHITATPAPNVTFNNIDYYTAGTEVTLGTNPPAYTITSATLTYGGNNHNIASVGGVYSFTMPAADVSVTVTEIQGDRYQLFEGNIVEGDYLIVYNLNGKLYSMNNVISSDHAFQYEVVNAIDNVITTDNADIVWHIAPNSDGNWTIYNAAIGKYAGGCLAQSGAQLYDETNNCATWIVGYSNEFQNCDDRFLGFRTRGTAIMGFYVMNDDPFNPIYTNLLLYKKVEVPTETYTLEIEGYNDDESGWYLIASPVSTTPSEVENMLTDETAAPYSYDLYRFNQAATAEWENYHQHSSDFNIIPGKGYLYANSQDVTLTFTGVPYSGNGEVQITKTHDVEFEGWNLVGNPFSVGAIVDMDFYRMNDDGSGIVPATGNTVNPMEGIFVYSDHSGDYVTFTPNSNNSNSAKGNNSNDASLVINLSKGNRGSAIDRAIVRFDSKSTLPKLQIFDGNTKLYIPQDFEEYAIVSSNRQGEMPLNFKAKETGMYTISFEGIDLKNIKLIDILDGKEIDLSETSSYTFIGSPADRQARFKIIFEGSENSDSSEISNFAYQSGTDIIVNGEGELQIFDVMGRMVMQKRIDGVETLREMSHATGVYILKLNEKTQKIVIR